MNLVERAKNIILQPKAEWEVIDTEPHTVQGLYTGYVMILAAIPAVCSFIGYSLIGSALGRTPIGVGVAQLLVGYLLSLGSVYVLALIIDALAPNFGGKKNFMQALKLSVFAATASWVAGVFSILPALSIIGALLGLYSLYLLYVGLPILMESPEDKSIPYLAVVIIAAIVLAVVIAAVTALAMPGAVRGF